MRKLLAITLFTFAFSAPVLSTGQTLYVNEIVASNVNGITEGSDNKHFDWFEIYNPTSSPIDIAGYYLTDNASATTKFKVPADVPASTTVPANGYLLIWASNDISRGPLHTNFAFAKGGEYVGIYTPGGVLVDGKSFGAQTDDVSFGRNPDGGTSFSYYSTSSPGASNSTGVVQLTQLAPPTFSHVAGFHNAAFSLTITHTGSEVSLWYSIDGSEPVNSNTPVVWQYKNIYNDNGSTEQQTIAGGLNQGLINSQYVSQLYSAPLPIVDRTVESNSVSSKNSSYDFDPFFIPSYNVFKGTTVRVRAYKEGFLPSEIVTRTFFVNATNPKYPVPVIAITTSENNLFDYNSGIYTAGRTFDQFRTDVPSAVAWLCTPGNYTGSGDTWERRGHVEYFENSSTLSQPFSLRIHGGCSRSVRYKSLRLYSDTEFNLPIFPETPTSFPKRLILRNSGNDFSSTMLRDVFYQSLVRNLPFDTQLSRPAILFLNSEYWGIHNITERYDRFYLEKKHGVNRDQVDLMNVEENEVEEGDNTAYNTLNSFVASNSLADPSHYNTIKTMVEISGLTDYMITQMFSANSDWPQRNLRMWRSKIPNTAPNAPYGHDGRWRMMLYDIDWGVGFGSTFTENYFPRATGQIDGTDGGPIALLFKKLLENAEYKNYFLVRAADLLNTTFLPSRTTAFLSNIAPTYRAIMPDHLARWKTKESMTVWENEVGWVNEFMSLRPGSFRDNIRETFGSGYTNSTVTVDVSNAAAGYVKVNTIDILPATDGISSTPYPWSGTYFKDMTTTLQAVAKIGYHFIRWEDGSGNSLSTDDEISFVTPSGSASRKAIFAPGALPVVLQQFTAKKAGKQVEIQWQTSSEKNNDYFEVQRSGDLKQWVPIGSVKGAASTPNAQRYRIVDELPLNSLNYYRLKQVDFDGTFTNSRTVAVDMATSDLVEAGPNPVSDVLQIVVDKSLNKIDYDIVDIMGNSVAKDELECQSGKAVINVKALREGLFVLILKKKGEIKYRMKFVKQ